MEHTVECLRTYVLSVWETSTLFDTLRKVKNVQATMKHVSLLALLLSPSLCLAQFGYTPIPPSQTIINKYFSQIPGCACYIPAAIQLPKTPDFFPDYLKNSIDVSPTSVVTKVGQQVQIRFDASAICMGQSYKDKNGVAYPNNGPVGTAQWQAGSIQNLQNLSGVITFSGYQQAKADSIVISLNPQCWDTGAKCTTPDHVTQCNTSVTIPVTVLGSDATQAEIEDHKNHPNDAWFKPEFRPKQKAKSAKPTSKVNPN